MKQVLSELITYVNSLNERTPEEIPANEQFDLLFNLQKAQSKFDELRYTSRRDELLPEKNIASGYLKEIDRWINCLSYEIADQYYENLYDDDDYDDYNFTNYETEEEYWERVLGE